MIVLASASPQRRAILEQLGVEFRVEPPEVEELREGDPAAVVAENALRKARARARLRRRLADLGLAVGADLPARVERAGAHRAGLAQAAQAARAAQEVLLHLEAAVLAVHVLERRQPGLGCCDLQLALAHVLEVLGRTHDQVDDRADEREQRRGGGAADQQRVGDAPARVGEGPVHQREPDNDEEQEQQVDRQLQTVVLDAENGHGAHRRGECTDRVSRIRRAECLRLYRKSRPKA